jgi:hypothetical protein
MNNREYAGDPLRKALDVLPREIAPRRDLWPQINARLADQEQGSDMRTARQDHAALRPIVRIGLHKRPATARILAAATCLAAAVIAFILFMRPEPAINNHNGQPPALVLLEQDYTLIRDGVMDVLSIHCVHPQAHGCDDLRTGLDELDHSVRELIQAIAAEPVGSADSPWLMQRLRHTLNQANGLSNMAGSIL